MRKMIYILLLSMLMVSCQATEKPEYVKHPVVEISFDSFYLDGVFLNVRSLNADDVYGLAVRTDAPVPSACEVISKGTKAEGKRLFIAGLEKSTEYNVYCVGVLGESVGDVECIWIKTSSLYSWESSRSDILSFADMDLLPGGVSNKTPNRWNANRIRPHVTFIDSDGQEKWLHEAFLLIGGGDDKEGVVFHIPDGKEKSGEKDSWKRYADWWLGEDGDLKVLDKAISDAGLRIGKPSFRHKVVISMPDPIMLEYFYDKSSSTKYWGESFGRRLDFSDTSDQILAYRWFIDYVRELWAKASLQNVELAGFYILSEVLVAKPSGWNYKYKRWDEILPSVSNYLHEMKYGLYWIPYYQADGYDVTDKLGIDYTWLQPNKYWDYTEKKQKKSWKWVFNTMSAYGHGMELEFEGSHGEPGWSQCEEGVPRTSSSILETVRTDNDAQGTAKGKPNPQASRNKQLLRDYMREFKEAGFYGTARIATYSGTDALFELATSSDAKDREMYLEYCHFIVENPLRK